MYEETYFFHHSVPTEMSILLKEHFNRWYSLKMYYASVTLLGIPISIVCCIIFSVMIYLLSAQPLEFSRFAMFFAISLMLDFVGQSIGLCVGAWFDVVVCLYISLLQFEILSLHFILFFLERNFLGANTVYSNDDVCWFWCNTTRHSDLFKMGYIYFLYALWFGRLCGRDLW